MIGRAAAMMALAWSVAAAAMPAPGPTPAAEAAAVAWLKTVAVPFADTTPTAAELDRLLPHLDGARIVGIGEATHGDHQDQAFKAELIKALVRTGRIDTLALECNRAAGAAFDAYVGRGDGDLAALVRSPSFFRTWQDDEFAGLLLWLRAWNATAAVPVHVVGIDTQDAVRDAAFALAFIRARDAVLADRLTAATGPMASSAAQAAKFYPWVVATPQPAFVAAQAGTAAIAEALAHHPEWAAAPGYDDAVYAARVAVQGLAQYELEAGKPDFDPDKAPPEYATRRDRFMAANLAERVGRGHRAAFWAHDLHVWSDLDPAHRTSGYVSVGSELRRTLGAAFVSIGFTWSSGSFNTRASSGTPATKVVIASEWTPLTRRNDRPGELGSVFGRVGAPRFWVDLRRPPARVAAWGRAAYYRGWIGAMQKTGPWQSDPDDSAATLPSFDLLVYFRDITPSQLWPVPAK